MLPPLASTYHNLWIRSVESVLENRYIFEAFYLWLSRNKNDLKNNFLLSPAKTFNQKHKTFECKLEALEVYLAIMAFHKCVAESDPKTKQMAMTLHRRFIRFKNFLELF